MYSRNNRLDAQRAVGLMRKVATVIVVGSVLAIGFNLYVMVTYLIN